MIRRLFACPKCDSRMTYTQSVLGCICLPVYVLLIPLLAAVYMAFVPNGLSVTELNGLMLGAGIAFVLIAEGEWLRRNFYVLLDAPGRCALCLATGTAANYALSFIVNMALLLLLGGLSNPNNISITELADGEFGTQLAYVVFLAPLVEETLFRGALFGTIRAKNRAAAYIVSALLFSAAHVWQYALIYLDPRLFVYMLQYLPFSLVLAWQYERSGSIWTPIVFHMLHNTLALFLLTSL